MVWKSTEFLRKGESKMKTAKYMKEDVLVKKSVEALLDKLGPVEAVRFLNMPRIKRVESVRRHIEWQKTLDKDKFFAEVFKHNKTGN